MYFLLNMGIFQPAYVGLPGSNSPFGVPAVLTFFFQNTLVRHCLILGDSECWASDIIIPLRQATPRKTKISPENQWLEDAFTIEIVPF